MGGEIATEKCGKSVEKLADAAYGVGANDLVELADWWNVAYVGRPYNAAFYGDSHFTQSVRVALELAVAGEPPVLARRDGADRLAEARIALQMVGERTWGIDRSSAHDILIDRHIAEICDALDRGERLKTALPSPSRLVQNAYADFPDDVPRDGWHAKQYLLAAQALVDAYADVARFSSYATSATARRPDVPASAVPDLQAALDASFVPLDDPSLVEALAANVAGVIAAADSAEPTVVVMIARLLAEAGLHEEWTQTVLAPLAEVAHRADVVHALLPESQRDEFDALFEMLQEELDAGRHDDAEAALLMLEREAERISGFRAFDTARNRLRLRLSSFEGDAASAERASRLIEGAEHARDSNLDAAAALLETAAVSLGMRPEQVALEGHEILSATPVTVEDRAVALMASGKYGDAKELLVARPDLSSRGATLLLQLYRREGDYDGADRLVEALAADGHVRARHYLILAETALDVGRPPDGRAALESALDRGLGGPDLERFFERLAETERAARAHGEAVTARRAGVPQELEERALDRSSSFAERRRAVNALARTTNVDAILATAESMTGAEAELGDELLELAAELRLVPGPTLPVLWQGLVERHVAAGRNVEAEAWLAKTRPPLPPEELEARDINPDVAALTAWIPRVNLDRGSTELLRDGVEAEADGEFLAAANLYEAALNSGWLVGYGAALGCYVAAGAYDRALGLYRSSYSDLYVTALSAWNIGCAYAHLGYDDEASLSFHCYRRIAKHPPLARAAALQHYLGLRHGWREPDASPKAAEWAKEPRVQEQEARAKREYEADPIHGFATAEARLKRLLRDVPYSPGAYLLLRMYREQMGVSGRLSGLCDWA